MAKVNFAKTAILCGVLFQTTTSTNAQCSLIFDPFNSVQWPDTSTKTISIPPCTDQNKEFVYRECLNGTWSQPPVCSSIQQDLPLCPEGFTELGRICYMLSPNSTYPPKCPSDDVLPFKSYRYLISEDTPFWMPIKRNLSNGLGFMQWMETNDLYKTDFTDYSVDDNITDRNCIVSYGGDHFMATSCNETHQGICAYKKAEPWVTSDLCKSHNCVQKDFFDKTKCLCSGDSSTNVSVDAEFLSIFDNNAFYALQTNTCSMALEKINDTYTWISSQKEIDYTHWSKSVNFDKNPIYGASSPDGWVLATSPLPCSLYVLDIAILEPQLNLQLMTGIFTLQIDNSNFLKPLEDLPVFCFTNSDATTLTYRFSSLKKVIETSTTMTIQFPLITDAPGHYWCEGFKYDDLTVVTSNTVFAEIKPGYSEFVAMVSFEYGNYSLYDPLGESTIDLIDKILFNVFRGSDNLRNQYTLRIMKFQDLVQENSRMLVNIHITCINPDDEDRFGFVKTLMVDILKEIKVMSLVDFSSSDHCHEEKHGNLTWFRRPVGHRSTPREFCFKSNGTRLTRLCDGTFKDGAKWLPFEDCEIIPRSTLSDKLLSLLHLDITNSTDHELNRISTDYHELKVLDIYLIGEIYRKHNHSYDVNVEAVAKTVNHLLEIPNRSILQEAQLKTRATDTILNFLGDISLTYPTSFDIGLNNLIWASSESKSLSGIVVFGNWRIQPLSGSYSVEDLMKIKDLKSAAWLTHVSDANVTFSVFFNDYLFTEQRDLNLIGTIFGVILPNDNTSLNILHKISDQDQGEFCTSWYYNLNSKGSWILASKPQQLSSFALCEFQQSGYFGLTVTSKRAASNVTGDLIDILESEDYVSVTMQKLSNISERYDLFQPIDVSYVEEILQRTSKEEVDLGCLAKVVSNMHNINKEILYESQKSKKSTDGILRHIDNIVKKHEKRKEIINPNFVVVVGNIEGSNFSGIALFRNGEELEVKILDQNFTIDDAMSNASFDAAVLVEQINSKVIVTLFRDDALFNEDEPKSRIGGTIFGVIFPELEELSHPVSILYKIEKTNSSSQCGYWEFETLPGFWKEDSNTTTSVLNLTRCDFWHTTHYALLLVDTQFTNKTDTDTDAVEIVTIVCTVVSLLGLTCILLTAIFFRNWRSDVGNQILVHFVVVIIFQIIAFYGSSTITRDSKCDHYVLCLVVGVILHYSTVSQFCWMLVVAILQFRRFVDVLKAPPKNILIKSCVCGWLLPLIPVVTVFLADADSYVEVRYGLCYPSNFGLYLGVWVPVSLIVVINTGIYVNIIWNVTRKKTFCVDSSNREMIYQLKLAVLLFFMLGLTWAFGLLANFENGEVFLILFCCTAPLQGFVIFLFFIVCNPKTQSLYGKSAKKCCFKIKK